MSGILAISFIVAWTNWMLVVKCVTPKEKNKQKQKRALRKSQDFINDNFVRLFPVFFLLRYITSYNNRKIQVEQNFFYRESFKTRFICIK